MEYSKVIEFIREKRISLGLTQYQLGKLCGVPANTISRIECGDVSISSNQINVVAEELKLHDVEDFTEVKSRIKYWVKYHEHHNTRFF